MFLLFVSDSDDSENEGCLGSVTRHVMRPPGCSGKAKRGHLCFDASYETGRNYSFLIMQKNTLRKSLTQKN